MSNTMLHDLIPRPLRVVATGERLPVEALRTIHVPFELRRHGDELIRSFHYFGKVLRQVDPEAADITLGLDGTLAAEGWKIGIGSAAIQLCGGSQAGVCYAVTAMKQLLALGYARGSETAALDGGTIEDKPRFAWRGLMLDSVRHFQSKAMIKDVIRLIADWRLNVFHWHLTDAQGLRLPFTRVPASGEPCYTRADLAEIAAFATEHHVRIVPELDMPGHSNALLRHFPHYACDSAHPGAEFCLGNPEARAFLKTLLAEMMDFFPDSPIIHLGGDEADMTSWSNCPKCRTALQHAGLSQMRELENQFMNEMTRSVIAGGRRPMVWCTEAVHPADTLVQAWQSILEIHRTHPHGNQMVNSVHYSCYFDYPADSTEPRSAWMPELSEESVYQSFEPFAETLDRLCGTEACLWTEIVPEWRVLPKLAARLAAFAETAWIQPEDKDWHDFQRRKKQLEAVGYGNLPQM